MRNSLFTLSRISMLFVFTSIFGFTLFALFGFRAGASIFRPTWVWLTDLIISSIGLLTLFRGLK